MSASDTAAVDFASAGLFVSGAASLFVGGALQATARTNKGRSERIFFITNSP
jgi:hypothetical protein